MAKWKSEFMMSQVIFAVGCMSHIYTCIVFKWGCEFILVACLYFGDLLVSCRLLLVAASLSFFFRLPAVFWWFAGFVRFSACSYLVVRFCRLPACTLVVCWLRAIWCLWLLCCWFLPPHSRRRTEHSSHQTREEVKDNKRKAEHKRHQRRRTNQTPKGEQTCKWDFDLFRFKAKSLLQGCLDVSGYIASEATKVKICMLMT